MKASLRLPPACLPANRNVSNGNVATSRHNSLDRPVINGLNGFPSRHDQLQDRNGASERGAERGEGVAQRTRACSCAHDRSRRLDDVGQGGPVSRVRFQVGQCGEHQHQPDSVGDGVVQLQDQCTAAVCKPGEDSQLPQRARTIERYAHPFLGSCKDIVPIGGAPEIFVAVVIVDVEVVGLGPARPWTLVDHPLTQPRDLRHHSLDGGAHALRRRRALQEPHTHHGRPQLRVLLDVPDHASLLLMVSS